MSAYAVQQMPCTREAATGTAACTPARLFVGSPFSEPSERKTHRKIHGRSICQRLLKDDTEMIQRKLDQTE